MYHEFTTKLQESWDVEDEGDVHDLLNVEIHREGNVVSLKQTGYIERLVSEFLPDGLPKCFQSIKTPCDDKLEATVVAAVIEVAMETVDTKLKERFQSIVGALNYCVSNTRPDVAYAVGQLCRVLARPTPELLACAERVLCYLYRTHQIGLCYVADQNPLQECQTPIVGYKTFYIRVGLSLALSAIFPNLNQNTLVGLMVYQKSSKYFRFGVQNLVFLIKF